MTTKLLVTPSQERCYQAGSQPMLDCPDDWIDIANEIMKSIEKLMMPKVEVDLTLAECRRLAICA